MLTQVRKTGLDIHHDVTGSPTALPPLLGTTVYRVVQESLTNVLKHAGPDARVQVRTVWEPSRLTITVDDDGVARPEHRLGDGQGVVGMRERALSVGGDLDAGAKPGGGFQVRL
ncbi:MAG TPA: ATP-binding protein, partial [Beutenbergiaceae bacterium]|nr:ATP-binding protein [Beutenbergiaceae bacterium]